MPTIRAASDRFHTKLDWLDSWHSFSFGNHFDPKWLSFGPLRVINDDTVSPRSGFGMHPHGDMEIITIMVNGDPVDALSIIVHKSRAESRGRELCARLKDLIPRQLFQIAIQAAIGGKIIARENVKAMRKDVLAKCYGGDITRKRKLLEKQKAGKKRMRNIGNVEIPQSAFIAALKIGDN